MNENPAQDKVPGTAALEHSFYRQLADKPKFGMTVRSGRFEQVCSKPSVGRSFDNP